VVTAAPPPAAPAFARIDVNLSTSTRADGYPAWAGEGSALFVNLFKAPKSFSSAPSMPSTGCVEVHHTPAGPWTGDVAAPIAGFARDTIGVATATGKAPVAIRLEKATDQGYQARLGIIDDAAIVTVTFDADVPEIGGRTFTLKNRVLRMVAPAAPTSTPYRLPYTAGTTFHAEWKPLEGPVVWQLHSSEKIPGTGQTSHSVDCVSAAGMVSTTDIPGALLSLLDFTPDGPGDGGGGFAAIAPGAEVQATSTNGARINLRSDANTYAFLAVTP
jgi:hypothetical protein